MPSSIGCNAVEPQCQPSPDFWNAKDFLILTRCASGKLALLPGDGLACPDCRSQHEPVQAEAIGLQAANGDSTTISTSARTLALCSEILLSTGIIRVTDRKAPQPLAEWICATQRSTASASGAR